MANIIQNSIRKIQNYIQSRKEVSPVPQEPPRISFGPTANRAIRNVTNFVNQPFNRLSQRSQEIIDAAGTGEANQRILNTFPKAAGIVGQEFLGGITGNSNISRGAGRAFGDFTGVVAKGPVQMGVGLAQSFNPKTRSQGIRNVASGAAKTGLSVLGAQKMTPVFAGVGGAIGGGIAKLQGEDVMGGIGRGVGQAFQTRGLTRFTDPVVFGASGAARDLATSALGQQAIGRTISGVGNVIEDNILSKIDGIDQTGLDNLGSFMFGALISSGGTKQDWDTLSREVKTRIKDPFQRKQIQQAIDVSRASGEQPRDLFGRFMKHSTNTQKKVQEFIKDPNISDVQRKALRATLGFDPGDPRSGFVDFNAKIGSSQQPPKLQQINAEINPFDKKPEVSVDKKGKIKFKPQDVKVEKPDMTIRPDVQKILDQGKYSRTGLKETLQDSYIRIKRLQNLKNVKVDEKSDIYIAEELMHGRVGTRLMNSFDEVKAIDDKIVQLEKLDKNINKKVQDYLIAQHAPERNKNLGDGAAGITTKQAKKILKELESDPNAAQIKEVVQDFENLNKKVLDTLYEGQIITKELYDGLRSKYKHHIPLNRIMDETDDITQILTGKGRDVRGTGIKTAKGSDREVSDIAGNIVTNLQQAIIRSEKNRVNLAVLEFARKNPDLGLFQIEKPKAIGTSFDGRPIMAKTNDPQILTLRENGKEVQLRIKNDNLAATIRGINIQKLPEFFNGVSAFTRFYSQLHTRFNPEFAIPNIVRDSQEMATYLSSQKDIGITGAGKALSKQPQSVKVMIDAVRGVDNADTRLYKQMQMDGGTTGGMALSTKQDVEMNIEKIRQLNRSNPRKAASKVLESFDTWNQVFEDATRFSVYKQALENGASRQRAASLAKNASLNFNRKGTATPIVNSLWMFSNASIQGTTKMLTALKNPKTLAAVTAAVGSSVYATNEWNDAVDPDWREKVTEWDQQSNLVIMLPSKSGAKYITIPVSWGLKPIKTTMDAMYQAYRGDDMDFQKASEDIAQAFIDGYNPTGGTDLISSVMPTILDIPVELIRNKGWYGGPIKPTYLEGEPEQKQYKKSTEKKLSGRVAIYIADKLAQYSADKIAISPDHILYAYNQYIGGVGRFGTKIFDTASSLTKGNAPDLNTVPFSSRFLKEKTEDDIKTQKYYDGMDKISQKYTKSWDTKLENAYSYLKSPKTIDEYGFQSRNINESLAFAQIRLANPQIVAREAEEARLRSKINGTPYNPMYDLPYDKQRVVLTLASLPPGQQKSALQKENIEWLKPYWNDVAKYSNEMKRLGIFKDNPNYETAPKASARAQALMDQGNWNDPEVRAYLQANNEYKNRVLAELGLPPLESTTSKWGSYTKRPKKVSFNMGKVKKARVVKSSPQKIFGTRKISTPKIKAVEAPRVRAVARIDTPRIRKVKFKA